MFKWFGQTKDRVRGVEVASVASQELILALARMSAARSKAVGGAFYSASRQLTGRSEQKTKRVAKLNGFQVRCLKALGIYWVVEDQAKDLKAIADHLRFSGDIQSKLSDQWSGLHFEAAAVDIENRVPAVLERFGQDAADDNTVSVAMVRGLRKLVDPTVDPATNGMVENDTKKVTATRA